MTQTNPNSLERHMLSMLKTAAGFKSSFIEKWLMSKIHNVPLLLSTLCMSPGH